MWHTVLLSPVCPQLCMGDVPNRLRWWLHTLVGGEECEMKKKWVGVVRQAEQAFWTIVFSAHKRVGNRGVILPKRFNSVSKIRRFLTRFMTPCLANRVIGNLDLRRINGQLAVPVGDGIGATPIVKSQVLKKSARCVTIAVWFQFDPSDRFFACIS